MKFKEGMLYKFTGLWNPFHIKPDNIKPWLYIREWPEFPVFKLPKKSLLYLGEEKWYDSGQLGKFLYPGKIIYVQLHYNLEGNFTEIG